MKNPIFRKNTELIRFLKIINDESKIDVAGFYDLSDIAEKNKVGNLPKKEFIKEKIKKSGYNASGTHFAGNGIRSGIPISELIEILKNK